MIQINVSNEESKYGIKKEELDEVLPKIKGLKNIELIGLMMIGSQDKEKAKQEYKEMKKLFDKYKKEYDLKYLSMGMSNDYELAIENGSNMVRLGRALFG